MPETEHCPQILNRASEIGGAEKDPAQQYDYKGQTNPQRLRQIVIKTFPTLAALESEHSAVNSSPNNKIPGRPMPEPADQHCDDEIRVRARNPVTISAEWNVKIFAQPGRK